MRLLRGVLVALSIAGAVVIALALWEDASLSYRMPVLPRLLLAGGFFALIANTFYLVRTVPVAVPSRLAKLIGLWITVKERELTARGSKDVPSA